jgi:hypothetical protein
MTPVRKTEHQHSVRIDFDDGRFTYTQDENNQPAQRITVKRGDVVRWRCDHGNFSILFKSHTPFAVIGVHGKRGETTMDSLVTGDSGNYRYAVALVPDGGEPVVDDPEIDVTDG